jgi:hypothetical protein
MFPITNFANPDLVIEESESSDLNRLSGNLIFPAYGVLKRAMWNSLPTQLASKNRSQKTKKDELYHGACQTSDHFAQIPTLLTLFDCWQNTIFGLHCTVHTRY